MSAVDPLRNRLPNDPLDRDKALANAVDAIGLRIDAVEEKIDALSEKVDEADKRNLIRTIAILSTLMATIVLLLVDIILRGAGGA